MNSILQKIANILLTPLLSMLAFSGHPIVQPQIIYEPAPIVQQAVPQVNTSQNLGDFNPTAAGTYYLQGGISQTATTIYLSSFKEPISNVPYTMAYLNSNIEYGVIDPLTANRSELISFNGITQNSDGSAVLTGVVRGLSRSYPFTASTTITQTHAAQAQFILSNTPQVFTQYAAKQNNETITGAWSFPPPVGSSSPATQAYVLQTITGTSTLTFNQIVVVGNASGTISKGQVVFYNKSNSEWAPANSSTSTNIYNVLLGIAQGAGTNGVAITNGVLIKGLDSNQSGLSTGSTYYVSSTSPGSITSNVTNSAIGVAQSTTALYFDPFVFNVAFLNSANFSASTSFKTTAFGTTSVAITSSTTQPFLFNIKTFTSSGSFLVPTNVIRVWVKIVGGGSGGGSSNSAGGASGGGGGGYAEKMCDVSATTSITVTIGAGGTGGAIGANNGNAGGSTIFGNCATATAGGVGIANSDGTYHNGGAAGIGTVGDVLGAGQPGGAGLDFSGQGGGSMLGSGGSSVGGATGGSNATGYGGGGSGASGNAGSGGGNGSAGFAIVEW